MPQSPESSSIQHSTDPLAQLILHRRTISPKHYSEEVPTPNDVIEAIDIARNAPNHHRTEPCRFYLLDKARIREIGRLFGEVVRGDNPTPELQTRGDSKAKQWGAAPGLLVVTQFTPRASFLVENKPEVVREDYATCCCIVQNLLLLFENAGISAKWSTGPVWEHPSFRKVVGIQQPAPDEEVVALVFYGKSDLPGKVRPLSGLDEILVNHCQG